MTFCLPALRKRAGTGKVKHMETVKAILNQILLFFDDLAAKGKRLGAQGRRLSPKGRRRVLTLAAVFLLLVVLFTALVISSCRRPAAQAAEAGRTRTRGIVSEASAQQAVEAGLTVSSGVLPVNEASDPNQIDPEEVWAPEDEPVYDPEEEPGEDPAETPEESPSDEPESGEEPEDPQSGTEPTSEPVETPAPEDPETQTEAQAEAGAQYETLKKHDKSEAVTTLQYRLMELGYLDIDEPTNYFGSSTESALILFQRQHNLKQDGVAGSETQAILFGENAEHYCLKEGAEGQDVKALQEQLVDLGYLSSKDVDRVYGPVTVAAVEAFQKRNNLHVDGLAGEKTLELLYSDNAKISRELQKQQEAEAKAEAEAAKKKAAEEAAKKKAEEEAAKKKAAEEAAKKKAAEEAAKKKKTTAKPTTKKTATPKPTPKPTPTPKKDTRLDKFIAAANSKLGCEYVLGAKGPDKFDCSGFVYWCLKQAGVGGTRLNAAGYSQKGSWTKITSIGSLKKGDILFFRSDTNKSVNHTGIYVGGGNMIDASSGNGKVVKRALSAYWKRNFVWARRPWND